MKKKVIVGLVAAIWILATAVPQLVAKEKPRLGVLRFTNETSAGWWSSSVGRELSDMLAAELVSLKAFEVLERKEIDAVMGEQDLSATDRVSEKTKVRLKQLKGAQYLVAATVSAYEEDVKGTSGGVRIGPLSVGGAQNKAYIAVDLKVVDTETGEIVDARTIEAEAKGSALGAGLSISNFSVNGDTYKRTPAGKAIRACIIYIAEYLECSLVLGKEDECMEEWSQRESKRKNKTKGVIDID